MDKFTEKTLGCERKYTGKIISVDLLDIELPDGRKATFDSKTLSAWACYRMMK